MSKGARDERPEMITPRRCCQLTRILAKYATGGLILSYFQVSSWTYLAVAPFFAAELSTTLNPGYNLTHEEEEADWYSELAATRRGLVVTPLTLPTEIRGIVSSSKLARTATTWRQRVTS